MSVSSEPRLTTLSGQAYLWNFSGHKNAADFKQAVLVQVLLDFFNLVDVHHTMSRKIGDCWPPPPWNATVDHTMNDTKKTFRTEVMNLVMLLQNHLDCDVKLATKIKVFSSQAVGTRLTLYAFNMLPDGRFFATELASAPVPFSFGRWRYFMYDEMTKQEKFLEKINEFILRAEGTTVPQVLRMPVRILEE
ncbi:hypothetical protein G9A89_020011 [Geosiphon pyriformis]|nr:hypothetical protein G9A89_020011 [Geosiphon pyriformis]